MREQLIQYVNLLFAGAQDADEIRAEILQNTLDRYDDLIAQGKLPEAAYQLAISGIGDISEILSNVSSVRPASVHSQKDAPAAEPEDDPERRKMRAIAIAMYILSPVPLFILGDLGIGTLGLCLTIAIVAAATYIMINYGKQEPDNDNETPANNIQMTPASEPQARLRKSISSLIWAIGLASYFILSFVTGAWYITWLIFPITGCAEGLAKAIIDLKEASSNEI